MADGKPFAGVLGFPIVGKMADQMARGRRAERPSRFGGERRHVIVELPALNAGGSSM